MHLPWRQALVSLLAFLILIAPVAVRAQDDDAIRIDGSRIVTDIVQPLSETYAEDTGATLEIEISGTNSGLARLCDGEIDIASAARPIARAEEEACAENDIAWVEVLLAYDALAVITNPANSFADCLTLSHLATLWGPSATDNITTWDQIGPPRWESTAFELYAPASSDTTYDLLDSLLPGDGLRTDVNQQADPDALVTAVMEDVAALAFAPLTAVAGNEDVLTIALDDLSGAGCIAPEQETLEDGSYPAARGLYLYVNAASLQREAVAGLVEFLLSDEAREHIAAQGFTTSGDDLNEQVVANVADGVTGRQFSEGEPPYTIPLDVTGAVVIEAAAAVYPGLDDVADGLSEAYEGLSVTTSAFGNPAAYRKLCNTEIDVAGVTRPPTDDEAALCDENGVTFREIPVGHQATVMLVPEDADYAACLTSDAIAALWQDQGEDTVTNWSQLGDDFPDLDLTLFLPRDGQSQTDSILFQSSGQLLNPRRDALEQDNDALYRAAATANVEGALTYVTYEEFMESEAAVIPVAIDAGEGCVEPTLETIRDGSYLLSRPITVLVSQMALSRPETQAMVWYLVTTNGQNLLRDNNVLLLDEDVFAAYQETAVEWFTEAETLAAEAEAAAEEEASEAEGDTGEGAESETEEDSETDE